MGWHIRQRRRRRALCFHAHINYYIHNVLTCVCNNSINGINKHYKNYTSSCYTQEVEPSGFDCIFSLILYFFLLNNSFNTFSENYIQLLNMDSCVGIYWLRCAKARNEKGILDFVNNFLVWGQDYWTGGHNLDVSHYSRGRTATF